MSRPTLLRASPALSGILKQIGGADLVIVMLEADSGDHTLLWERAFFLVKAGGAYVVMRDTVTRPSGTEPDWLLATMLRTAELQGPRDGTQGASDRA